MSHWAEGDTEANGLRLHYHRTGGGKPPLLLLHGITDNGLCWSRVARSLERVYDVIMPDARGHGHSSRISGIFSVELLADEVASTIRALQLPRPALYGHSMGALTAMAVAARYPEQVRAIVLEDPPLFAAGQVRNPQHQTQARQGLMDLKRLPREERIRRGRTDNPGWDEEEILPWADAKAEVDLAVMDFFLGLTDYRWRDDLPRITCPVLLITGDVERGAIVTPEIAREAAALWRDGRIAHIAGAGHSIHRDRYEETMDAVRAFLAAP